LRDFSNDRWIEKIQKTYDLYSAKEVKKNLEYMHFNNEAPEFR